MTEDVGPRDLQGIIDLATSRGSTFFHKAEISKHDTQLYTGLVWPCDRLRATVFVTGEPDPTRGRRRADGGLPLSFSVRVCLWETGQIMLMGPLWAFEDTFKVRDAVGWIMRYAEDVEEAAAMVAHRARPVCAAWPAEGLGTL